MIRSLRFAVFFFVIILISCNQQPLNNSPNDVKCASLGEVVLKENTGNEQVVPLNGAHTLVNHYDFRTNHCYVDIVGVADPDSDVEHYARNEALFDGQTKQMLLLAIRMRHTVKESVVFSDSLRKKFKGAPTYEETTDLINQLMNYSAWTTH